MTYIERCTRLERFVQDSDCRSFSLSFVEVVRMKLHRIGWAAVVLFLTTASTIFSNEYCPFCTAVKQTLRQEMESMDAVAIGTLIPVENAPNGEIDGQAKFKVIQVIKGESIIDVGYVAEALYFGSSKSEKHFLLMGVDPSELIWSTPLPITESAEKYIAKIPTLPEDPVERLKFYHDHLEDPDTLLARDAYDEFAITPYDQVKAIKDTMNRKQLIAWIEDNSLSPDRKRLYLTMLGICGLPEDANLLEARLRSDNAEAKAGLDAMIACYLTLKGDAGLPLIDELFLKNTKSQYSETYSAIMALRFHGNEGGILDRSKVVQSMHHLLSRPELADLVIPDLARFEDWSQIDKLVDLFKSADESSSWVRVPVVNYLRACPLPVAAEKIKELEKIDPKAIQRAKTFFPIPSATPSATDSSSIQLRPVLDVEGAPTHIPRGSKIAANLRLDHDSELAFRTAKLAVASPLMIASTTENVNRTQVAFVCLVACLMLGLCMWLVFSSSGAHNLGILPLRVD